MELMIVNPPTILLLMNIICLLCLIVYMTIWDLLGLPSIGKRVMSLRVVTLTGDRISPRAALIRNVVRVVEFPVQMPLMVGMLMIMTPGTQRLGDLAAGTVVVITVSPVRGPDRQS